MDQLLITEPLARLCGTVESFPAKLVHTTELPNADRNSSDESVIR